METATIPELHEGATEEWSPLADLPDAPEPVKEGPELWLLVIHHEGQRTFRNVRELAACLSDPKVQDAIRDGATLLRIFESELLS